jgi:hypothetical protein
MFHSLLYFLGIWDKIKIKINLPKPKKYLTKVDPIYELYKSNLCYYISVRKWSLRYSNENTVGLQFLFILIPYPIELYRYGYHIDDSVVVCDEGEEETITEDIGIIYERKWNLLHQEEIEKQKKKDSINNIYETANKIFNENYE